MDLPGWPFRRGAAQRDDATCGGRRGREVTVRLAEDGEKLHAVDQRRVIAARHHRGGKDDGGGGAGETGADQRKSESERAAGLLGSGLTKTLAATLAAWLGGGDVRSPCFGFRISTLNLRPNSARSSLTSLRSAVAVR